MVLNGFNRFEITAALIRTSKRPYGADRVMKRSLDRTRRTRVDPALESGGWGARGWSSASVFFILGVYPFPRFVRIRSVRRSKRTLTYFESHFVRFFRFERRADRPGSPDAALRAQNNVRPEVSFVGCKSVHFASHDFI